jgi:methionine-rich copper-binding protein CopC
MFGSCARWWCRACAGALAAATLFTAMAVGWVASPVAAHEGIASSDPASGSTIDEPIDSITIDFGADIGETAQIALLAPDGTQITSDTTVTSATTATSQFEPIDDQGTYTVNYLATSVVDGHVLGGAITFTYGESSPDVMSPVLFGAIASVILGIGAWFSWRAHQRSRVGHDTHRTDTDSDMASADNR